MNNVLCALVTAYMVVLVVRAVFSWFPVQGGTMANVYRVLLDLTEPVLAPMRRLTFYFEIREKLEPMPLTRHISRNVSFRPQGAGYISGNTRYDEPPGFNWEIDYPYFDEAIWPGLAERVPAFEALKMTSAWAGHYDQNSFDNNAIL